MSRLAIPMATTTTYETNSLTPRLRHQGRGTGSIFWRKFATCDVDHVLVVVAAAPGMLEKLATRENRPG
jgi:hypothetical protein